MKKKILKWAENAFELEDVYCPLCGRGFQIGDAIYEVLTEPLSDDPDDRLVIHVHEECLEKVKIK